jgi:glucan phosphoethanolaminetransferase (alkaline phosphatase superfamily)
MRGDVSARAPWIATKLSLLALGIWLTNHDVARGFLLFASSGRGVRLALQAVFWVAAAGAVFTLAFSPLRRRHAVWIALILISTVLGDFFFRVTGDRVTVRALDALWSVMLAVGPSSELPKVIAFYGPEAVASALGTAALAAGFLIRAPVLPLTKLLPVAMLPLVPCLLMGAHVVYRAGTDDFERVGSPQQFMPISVLGVLLATPSTARPPEPLMTSPTAPAVPGHLVLIVDESIRGDFVDLTDRSDTTPFLASMADEIADFGLAVSAHNCSQASNIILRAGADPRRLGERGHELLRNPFIWQYARRAGFGTTFIDAQRIVGWRQNHFYDPERELIDDVIEIDQDLGAHIDREAARALAEVLNREAPQFVIVNKSGAHFPYESRYPASEAVFTPPSESHDRRAAALRHYRNAVRWSVDEFFAFLLPRVDLSRLSILYTSDHGQNLWDDGTPAPHCRPFGPIVQEFVVPLLVFSRVEELAERFRQAATLNRHRASHFQVFPTLLNLMGYPTREIERYYDDLFAYQAAPLGYATGPIAGRFARPARWHVRGDFGPLVTAGDEAGPGR